MSCVLIQFSVFNLFVFKNIYYSIVKDTDLQYYQHLKIKASRYLISGDPSLFT